MGRGLLICQLALVVLLFVLADTGRGGPSAAPDESVRAYAQEHGLALSVTSTDGAAFDLVVPGNYSRPSGDGKAHTVALRRPYYIERTARHAGTSWTAAHAALAALPAPADGRVLRLPTEAELFHAGRQRPGLSTGAQTWAWCADWFGQPPPQHVADPVGPRTGARRVILHLGTGRRAARDPEHAHANLTVRRVMETGWRGPKRVIIRTAERVPGGAPIPAPGFEIRLIRILDRLSDRQRGQPAVWTPLAGRTPLTLNMLAGRYYFAAVRVDAEGEAHLGPELKVNVLPGPADAAPLTFDVWIPRGSGRGER